MGAQSAFILSISVVSLWEEVISLSSESLLPPNSAFDPARRSAPLVAPIEPRRSIDAALFSNNLWLRLGEVTFGEVAFCCGCSIVTTKSALITLCQFSTQKANVGCIVFAKSASVNVVQKVGSSGHSR